ncbi:hypothetical protein [Pseudorhizobium flavum]|uniref:Uncharacterized protein n=1 Tax=Pseudorhizobium flavum TaxID=1335061 RepID=A0A7X0DE76_9HYPH|nr:hypothetical protein [Pseudorhizobium flavum]MBB6179839.1 hypothetical protein [Pseudorhizobium flavum]CAD6597117.1 hypothetical protein RFYW14_00457 [Pseudorhizobium flavum]
MKEPQRFLDIPRERFPLTAVKCHQLRNNIRAAAIGFDNLGTSSGQTVGRELDQAEHHLDRAWNLIVGIEDAERRREWADSATI